MMFNMYNYIIKVLLQFQYLDIHVHVRQYCQVNFNSCKLDTSIQACIFTMLTFQTVITYMVCTW